MVNDKIKIKNPQGLHARPAAILCKVATQFESSIKFSKDGIDVNGKSVMGVMMLAAECGSYVDVMIDGNDEGLAWKAIKELADNNFNE
jgi:phosphocarrier protein